MLKSLKALVFLAFLGVPAGSATAATILENFVFTFTAPASGTVLYGLSYSTFGGANVLSNLSPYTSLTPGGGVKVSGGMGTYSQTISVDPNLDYSGFVRTSGGSLISTSYSVSAVPLPAGFSLFALGIVCLAGLTYHAWNERRSRSVPAGNMPIASV